MKCENKIKIQALGLTIALVVTLGALLNFMAYTQTNVEAFILASM